MTILTKTNRCTAGKDDWRRRPYQQWIALAMVAAAVTGCGSADVRKYAVSGTVTLNGEPVEHGLIILEPSDGKGPPDSAAITHGAFDMVATAGEKLVRITATKETDEETLNAMGMPVKKQVDLLPAKYNRQSTLKSKVVDDPGQNKLRFDLKVAQ